MIRISGAQEDQMTLTVPGSAADPISLKKLSRTLRELPPRLPVAPPPATADVRWELCAPGRYAVTTGEAVVGYVDVVGAVFVVLAGRRYDRATEVAQTLVFEEAVAALIRADSSGKA
jgi:hypothetical protein